MEYILYINIVILRIFYVYNAENSSHVIYLYVNVYILIFTTATQSFGTIPTSPSGRSQPKRLGRLVVSPVYPYGLRDDDPTKTNIIETFGSLVSEKEPLDPNLLMRTKTWSCASKCAAAIARF